MKLTNLTAQARGQRIEVDFHRPITIFAGPTGAGKTTRLHCIQMALTGAVTADGKARTKPGEVFELMSAAGERVSARCAFDGVEVERTISQTTEGECSQSILIDGMRAAKLAEANDVIAKRIGELTRVDVVGLLAKDPSKRRAELLAACRSQATPLTREQLETEFSRVVSEALAEAHAAVDKLASADEPSPAKLEDAMRIAAAVTEPFKLQIDPKAGLLASAENARDAARERVTTTQADIRRAQQVIDQYATQASEQSEAGDLTEVRAELDQLNAEIARVSQEIGEATLTQGTRAGIERRLDELLGVGDVDAATRALEDAVAKAAEVQSASEGMGTDDTERIEALRRMHAIHAKAMRDAETELAESRATVAALRRAAETCSAGGPCPTCTRPLDEQVAAILAASIRAAEQECEDRADVCDAVTFEANEAALALREAEDARNAALASGSARAALAEAARRQVEAAQQAVARARAAMSERATLQERARTLPVLDVDALRRQRASAETRRDELQAIERRLAADETRVRMYLEAQRQRDDLRAALPARQMESKAYAAVADLVARAAVAPMTSAVNAALPDGWTLGIDVSTAAFGIWRGERYTPFSGLSGGERAMAVAAVAVGMGAVSGNRWRGVLIDGAEAVGGADWQTDDGAGAGLFAAFMAALARAVDAGVVHQVIVTTSRAPQGPELKAIERAGVDVRFMGTVRRMHDAEPAALNIDPRPEPAALNIDPRPEPAALNIDPRPEPAGHSAPDVSVGDVLARISGRGFGRKAAELVLRDLTGRDDPPHSSQTLRRVLREAVETSMKNSGVSPRRMLNLIELAIEAHPVARSEKPADVSAPEIGPCDDPA